MATEEDVASGLYRWINSLQITDHVDTLHDLTDGEILWNVLQSVDRIAFSSSLPEDTSKLDSSNSAVWIPKWNNLKHVYDALSMFLIEECGQKLPLFKVGGSKTRMNPDIKAIAQHSSLADAIVIMKLCVIAATNCAERIEFLTKMQDLTEETQKVLMETIQEAEIANSEEEINSELEATDQEEDDVFVQDENSTQVFNDNTTVNVTGTGGDLAFEERLAKVIADNQRIAHEKRDLEKQITDMHTRYEHLQERHDRSQDELKEANDRLAAVLTGRGDTGQSKEAKNESVIAALENRVAEADTEVEELRKTNEVLKIKADRVQKLQDDFDEIKIERDKLSRKANTAEKYRQKLEASQDMEKENVSLKIKVTELQAKLRHDDSTQASSSDLQREIDEYRRLLPSIEQERYEVNEMKKRLEFDFHILQTRYQDTEEQLRKAHLANEDLQGQLRDREDGILPTTPSKTEENLRIKDLETEEEADFAAAEARLTEALLKDNENKKTTGENGEAPENDDGISEDELRAIMAAMRAQMQAGTAQERESGLKVQKKMVIMLERARSKNVSLVEHVKKQSDLIKELQEREVPSTERQATPPPTIAAPSTPTPPPKEKVPESESEAQVEAATQLITNLKREIKLMTSAWYEQNQRIAALGPAGGGAGAVALMRTKMNSNALVGSASVLEEPKSFLGKQRRLLDRAVLSGGVRISRG